MAMTLDQVLERAAFVRKPLKLTDKRLKRRWSGLLLVEHVDLTNDELVCINPYGRTREEHRFREDELPSLMMYGLRVIHDPGNPRVLDLDVEKLA